MKYISVAIIIAVGLLTVRGAVFILTLAYTDSNSNIKIAKGLIKQYSLLDSFQFSGNAQGRGGGQVAIATSSDKTVVIPTPSPSVALPDSPIPLTDYLDSQGQPSSFSARAILARDYGIQEYRGTAEQNIYLYHLLTAKKAVRTQTIINSKDQ